MKTTKRMITLGAIPLLLLGPIACGSDSGNSDDGGSNANASSPEDLGDEPVASGDLPNELICDSYSSVDLRIVLVTVDDTSHFSSSCSWESVAMPGKNRGDLLGFSLEEGLPADFEALQDVLGQEDVEFTRITEIPAAPGFTYGFQMPVGISSFYDEAVTVAQYLVDDAGKGASCVYHPVYPDLAYDEEEPWLAERVQPVSDTCSELLQAAMSQ